jgi:hypothetical protein
MARVISPLLSGKASGQIMKSLVFFPWKSINAVRSYVIPANPGSPLQDTIRAQLKAAVDKWHATLYTTFDKTAWNLYATTMAAIQSGFNVMVKCYIAMVRLGNTWQKIWNAEVEEVSATEMTITCDVDENLTHRIHYGESKNFMPTTKDVEASGKVATFALTELTQDLIYYFWIEDIETSSAGSRTGVYRWQHHYEA